MRDAHEPTEMELRMGLKNQAELIRDRVNHITSTWEQSLLVQQHISNRVREVMLLVVLG